LPIGLKIVATKEKSNYKWWMWSGAHGSTHNYDARGHGFDPSPKPRTAFSEALISLLSDHRLKNDFIVYNIVMSS
jgi:hypothetical protein